MSNINFVPDDYVQKCETQRANIMYLVLFVVMMLALAATFGVIRLRQYRVAQDMKAADEKLATLEEELVKFEKLQKDLSSMETTADLSVGLIETLPRSVLLAYLTNTLPDGVSLKTIRLTERQINVRNSAVTNNYSKAKNETKSAYTRVKRKVIDIEGYSPTDVEVATYISNLSLCSLVEDVSLHESKEFKSKNDTYRIFKIDAVISENVSITADDIEKIASYNSFTYNIGF